jgi:hypothetical protein
VNLQTLRTSDAARCRHHQNQENASSTAFDLEGNKKNTVSSCTA